MSVDYTVYVILGALNPEWDQNNSSKKEKAFDHDFPDNWKFDPLTGEELWREVSETEDLEDFNFGPGPDIEVVYATGSCEDGTVVGHVLVTCDFRSYESNPKLINLPLVSELWDNTKKRLRDAGVGFADSDFGLYTVMYIG